MEFPCRGSCTKGKAPLEAPDRSWSLSQSTARPRANTTDPTAPLTLAVPGDARAAVVPCPARPSGTQRGFRGAPTAPNPHALERPASWPGAYLPLGGRSTPRRLLFSCRRRHPQHRSPGSAGSRTTQTTPPRPARPASGFRLRHFRKEVWPRRAGAREGAEAIFAGVISGGR